MTCSFQSEEEQKLEEVYAEKDKQTFPSQRGSIKSFSSSYRSDQSARPKIEGGIFHGSVAMQSKSEKPCKPDPIARNNSKKL